MLVNERTFMKLNYRNLWRTKKLEVESEDEHGKKIQETAKNNTELT